MKIPAILALPLLALGPAAAHATDISGLWVVSTSLAQAPVTMDCSILQIGVELSGWCAPEGPGAVPVALSGRLDQTRASWGYDIDVQGQSVRVAYRGTLSSDSRGMSGSLTYGASSAGLTAVRK